jgi:hypothetical protein
LLDRLGAGTRCERSGSIRDDNGGLPVDQISYEGRQPVRAKRHYSATGEFSASSHQHQCSSVTSEVADQWRLARSGTLHPAHDALVPMAYFLHVDHNLSAGSQLVRELCDLDFGAHRTAEALPPCRAFMRPGVFSRVNTSRRYVTAPQTLQRVTRS